MEILTPNKHLLYEVVRIDGADESEFIAQVEAAGFKLVKNYPALPRNYRFESPEGMEEWDARWHLNEMPLVEDQGDKGDDYVARGESITEPTEFTTKLTRPLHEWQRGLLVGEKSKNGAAYRMNTRYGRQWGVAHVANALATAPFLTPLNKDFSFTPKRVGNGVDYYCLDTGVDDDHDEFNEGVYGTRAYFAPDGDDFYQVGTDDQNHGTGMVTCGAGNSMGLAVNTRVFWAKGLDGNNSGQQSALIDAMNALVAVFTADTTNRPGVMNNSWSSTSSTAYTTATDAAVDAGMVMVASAGNSGDATLNYPAAYNDVISVLALDIDRGRSSFSTFGSTINVCAPGREILQGWRGNTQNWGDGTSPAGGLATGAVCAILQGYSRPTGRADVLAIKDYVENTAVIQNGASVPSGTADNIIFVGELSQAEAPRISGLKNLISPWGNKIRSDSVSKAVSSPPGIGPAWSEKTYWEDRVQTQQLHIASPTPDGASVSPFQSRADMKWGGWLMRNNGFNDIDVDVEGDAGNLGYSLNVRNQNDGDGNSVGVPNSAHPDNGDFAFLGSSSGVNTRADQFIPVRMVPESNPLSLFDLFDNLDYQSGDATGWTTNSGTFSVKTNTTNFEVAYYGTHWAEAVGDTVVEQVKALSSSVSTAKIDAGEMYFMFRALLGTSFIGSPGDQLRVQVTALDGSDVVISDVFDTGTLASNTSGSTTWDAPGVVTDQVLLPSGTRKLRITKTWTLQAGSTVNCCLDGMYGWIYEKTSKGDALAALIDKGQAGYDLNCLHRSFNIDSDDQLRMVVGTFDFSTAAGAATGSLLVDQWYSTHNWTEVFARGKIPAGTEFFFIGMQAFRRLGNAANAYFREVELLVHSGPSQRRLGSVCRAVSKGVNPSIVTSGGEPNAIVSFSS